MLEISFAPGKTPPQKRMGEEVRAKIHLSQRAGTTNLSDEDREEGCIKIQMTTDWEKGYQLPYRHKILFSTPVLFLTDQHAKLNPWGMVDMYVCSIWKSSIWKTFRKVLVSYNGEREPIIFKAAYFLTPTQYYWYLVYTPSTRIC